MEMAMAMKLAMVMEMVMAIAMVMATARATITKGGLPIHVPAMCSAVAGATPCLSTPMDTKESAFTSTVSWG